MSQIQLFYPLWTMFSLNKNCQRNTIIINVFIVLTGHLYFLNTPIYVSIFLSVDKKYKLSFNLKFVTCILYLDKRKRSIFFNIKFNPSSKKIFSNIIYIDFIFGQF